jgi:hypothetical protein
MLRHAPPCMIAEEEEAEEEEEGYSKQKRE